ncbi:MAG: LapA family protein [Gracilibacteraceae bacterium]|jgi:uncharacterized integral membrane protein|nr:LapA family protein [Gracilibacteraceae bacterium]
MAGFGLILAIIIALAVVIFTVQNAATVSVSFILWTADMPLAVVIFCSVLAGALLMFCLALYKTLRDRWHSRHGDKSGKRRLKKEENAHRKDAAPEKAAIAATTATTATAAETAAPGAAADATDAAAASPDSKSPV